MKSNSGKLEKLQQDWNDLAELDPMWAIASIQGRKFNKWSPKEFFLSGRTYITEALSIIKQSGIELNKESVLDFGCGIGRLTQALAGEFDVCYGVDISPRMIELAKQFNQFGYRCRYILNTSSDLEIFESNFFDFIYTAEVLQHIPPDLARNYLREFIRICKPGAVIMFQVPVGRLIVDEKTNYLKSLPRYHPLRIMNRIRGILIGHDISSRYYRLRKLGLSKKWLYDKLGLRPHIQMNILGEKEIIEFMRRLGAIDVWIVEREHPEMLNKIFVFRKEIKSL